MKLVATPDNPIPSEAVVMQVTTDDGTPLRAAHWRPTTRQLRGTVCLLQGRAEFIEKYFEVVTELRGRGFAVVAFDWRGQGGSGRALEDPRKGHVAAFSLYGLDLEAVAAQVLEPLMPPPYFTLAHSMGGAIALASARDGGLPFERIVTTAPMIALSMVRSVALARGAASVLRGLGLGASYIPGGGATSIATKPFKDNPLTSDPARYARNADAAAALGAGAIGDPTIAWVDAAFRFMHRLNEPRAPLEIRTPTLVIAAGSDAVVSTPAIELFAARLKAGHAIVLPGALHEILMERDYVRDAFWAAFDAFIPGTPDPDLDASGVQEFEGGRMEATVSGRDD